MLLETTVHDRLVLLMEEWVCANVLYGERGGLQCDLPGRGAPPRIANNVPDLYVAACADIPLVVGEAKTAIDIETKRSQEQIAAFLKHCDRVKPSIFVLAVPWYRIAYARNLLRRLCNKHKLTAVRTLVVENLPG